MKSINPFNGELLEEYPEDSEKELQRRLNKAQERFKHYRNSKMEEREDKLKRLAELLRSRSDQYAPMLTLEMGKPLREARAEIEKCAWVCEYYAENAASFLKPEYVETDADKSYISYEPLGVILAVMPWNFPFWQVFRFAAPTLMAGNTAVLKHASNVQGSARLIEEVIKDAGFEDGCFQNLCISAGRVQEVLENPIVKGASVTGSEAAGAAVAETCGREIKTTVLELGGSNAFVVLADADIPKAASLGVRARMINNAQSCIAAKRFILEESIAEEFITGYVSIISSLKSGDPILEDTDVGPLARVDLAKELEDQVHRSIQAGAELRYGGRREEAYFEPTVLTGVRPGMPAFDEELFGPVASMIIASDAEEAIDLANKSSFGLGASIITKDVERAQELSRRIEDGAVFINELVKSDPRLPFGGTKRSGYGRELSLLGIREFVNAKTVFVKRQL